jgi:hypothetical protein
MLTSVGLGERVPAPASRRDHYRLRDNAWAIQYTNQNEVTSAVLKAAEAGITATEDGTLARQRLIQIRKLLQLPVRGDSCAGRPLVSAIWIQRDVAHRRSVFSDTLNRNDHRAAKRRRCAGRGRMGPRRHT